MKKVTRGTVAVLFSFVLMLSTIVPALASKQNTPQFSNWAVVELSEGEKYGIFPMEWYYDGFTTEITKERLEMLLTKTEAKIAELDLKKKADYNRSERKLSSSRENIIHELYQIIAQYELSVGDSAVSYMQERKILRGNAKGLGLERNATTEEAILFATRLIQDTYYQTQAGSKGVAWKVENNGNQVYLLGSIHLATPEIYPFNEQLLAAFHESDALFVEVNIFDQKGLEYYTDASMFKDGTIEDMVSKETYEKTKKVFAKYNLPEESFMMMKPWALASYLSNLSLSETIGLSPEELANSGIDMYFLSNALLAGKPIVELEGMKAQTDMFDGLSKEGQEQYLVDVLDSILESEDLEVSEAELLLEWLGHWNKGDIAAFTESLKTIEGEPSEFDEMLFGERDKNMSEKITELLESNDKGTYFIVVGAGHFLTSESILYHLQDKGYKVEEFYQ